MRGIHDEFSYGQVSTMDNFKDIIRFLAVYKMNTLFIYFEDTFSSRSTRPSASVAAPSRASKSTSSKRSRSRWASRSFPSSRCSATRGAVDARRSAAVCRVSRRHSFSIDDDTFEFLTNCFDELADTFDSQYFHAGPRRIVGPGLRQERSSRQARRTRAGARRPLSPHQRPAQEPRQDDDHVRRHHSQLARDPEPDSQRHHSDGLAVRTGRALSHARRAGLEGDFPLLVLPGMNNWDRIFPDHVEGDDQHSQLHARLLSPRRIRWADHLDLGRQRLEEPARAVVLRLCLRRRSDLVARRRPTWSSSPTASSRCTTAPARGRTSSRSTPSWKNGPGGIRCSTTSGIHSCRARTKSLTPSKSCYRVDEDARVAEELCDMSAATRRTPQRRRRLPARTARGCTSTTWKASGWCDDLQCLRSGKSFRQAR